MKFIFFVLCMITVLLISCGPSRKAIDAKEDSSFNKWINHSKSQLVRQWGQPDSVMPDGRNGEVLIYKEGIDFLSVMNEKYTGPQHSFRKEMFVNADSLIYHWRAWRRK